jgi:hypothetical protein
MKTRIIFLFKSLIFQFINLNKKISFFTSQSISNLLGPSNKCELDYYGYFQKFEFSNLTVLELGGTQRPIFNKSEVKQYI